MFERSIPRGRLPSAIFFPTYLSEAIDHNKFTSHRLLKNALCAEDA